MRQSEAFSPLSPYRYQVALKVLAKDEPFFWMGDRLAYDLEEINHDPAALEMPGFWAVFSTFEGVWTCARFARQVVAPLPVAELSWQPITGPWESSCSQEEYIAYVEEIQKKIAEGWVYQVNACRQVRAPMIEQSLLPLMHEILRKNPAPFSSFLRLPQIEIASASPELFLKREGSIVTSAPIKGTKLPGADDIPFGSKDTAENIMIVDLIRNDLGRICQTGSIGVPRLLETQPHPGLSHLVSYVEGRLREGILWQEISTALLPPGSVSGAPKSSAISTINELEGLDRGPYCGALGWVEGSNALLSLAIRIFWQANDGILRFGTGAGITWGSEPRGEWEETELKAERLIGIANGAIS